MAYPPQLLKQLGNFDLDPCAPIKRPWPVAKKHYTIEDNGLMQDWEGRVFMNPPYGREMLHWLNKMAMHKNGIALTFARTETQQFHQYIFPVAHALFFIKGRLTFYTVEGKPATDKKGNASGAGSPSVLISYSMADTEILRNSKIKGALIELKK